MIDNMVVSLALTGRPYRFDISLENFFAVLRRKYSSSSSHSMCQGFGVVQSFSIKSILIWLFACGLGEKKT